MSWYMITSINSINRDKKGLILKIVLIKVMFISEIGTVWYLEAIQSLKLQKNREFKELTKYQLNKIN